MHVYVYEQIIVYTGISDNMIVDHVTSANTCFDGSKNPPISFFNCPSDQMVDIYGCNKSDEIHEQLFLNITSTK